MSAVPYNTPTRPMHAHTRTGKTFKNLLIWVLLIVLGFFMILPLFWVLSTALKGTSDIYHIPPEFFPKEFHFENFVTGSQTIQFGLHFINSLIITSLSVIGAVLSSMLVGFGLSRIRFPGRRVWFYLFVGSMMFPAIVGVFPLFQLFRRLGFVDTWIPLILPAWLGNPLFIFLARQFYLSIPFDVDEAAKLDGANYWQIFTRIMVPLTQPLWITMMIIAFQSSWNDYLNPLIYLISDTKWPLALSMATFSGSFAGVSTTRWNLFMATNLLYMLPPLIIFFLAQRYFIEGLGSLGNTGRK
ncbi:MAG: carbohydrate ABC transporter permease [Omnitrophica WOR_2 bacterium]